MKTWKFTELGVRVHFTLDWEKDVKDDKARAEFYDGTKHDDAGASCAMGENGNIFIWISEENTDDFIELIDYISHEVFHAIGYMYKDLGDDTKLRAVSEIPAYIQGYLTSEILSHLGYE